MQVHFRNRPAFVSGDDLGQTTISRHCFHNFMRGRSHGK